MTGKTWTAEDIGWRDSETFNANMGRAIRRMRIGDGLMIEKGENFGMWERVDARKTDKIQIVKI